MKTAVLAAALVLIAGCAGTPKVAEDTEALRDYVEVGELAETDRIRTHGSDTWKPLTLHFALYSARDGDFLLEFSRLCRELYDNTLITPDRRHDHNVIRRGMDTLRGCRIDGMYPLTEAQAQEVEALARGTKRGN